MGSTTPLDYTPTPRSSSLWDGEFQNEALRKTNLSHLDARDLELLTHYLTHTSQTIPYDKADLYALHIGIPNLALSSKPLMSSVLALAAACQCHDLLPTTGEQCTLPLGQIQDLLEVAEKHHSSSLHQIQKAISTDRHDTVLANATLMTLYGSAVHCVRIRLIGLHNEGRLSNPLPRGFVPAHSQWISLIRAVHCAFIGLRADVEYEGVETSATFSSLHDVDRELDLHDSIGEVKCSQDGPSETTLRLFLPIVTATMAGAMEKLRARVQRTRREGHSANSKDIQACTGALDILESIVADILPGINKMNATVTTENTHDGFIGRLSLIAPWLRAYAARVTSNGHTPNSMSFGSGPPAVFTSGPLRRKITAFLNRVDAAFLSLVQERLEHMTFPEFGETGRGPQNESAAIQCAMDIFAYWLVLVCLLDGVWWIGGIGMWELGRVVSYMKGFHSGESGQKEETWWPASMCAIRMELAKQRV